MSQKTALPNHDAVKAAAQSLLRAGSASYSEIANMAGRSPQIIRYWAIMLGAENARQEHLARLWREALRQNE